MKHALPWPASCLHHHGRAWVVCVLVALTMRLAHAQSTDPLTRASNCLEVLQNWYDPDTGRWTTTSWWNAANALTAITEFTRATGDKRYLEVITNSFDKCKRFVVDDDPERPAWVCENFINAWYDDEGWWVLLWLDVYELTEDDRYLEMARVTFADMTQGWDDVCGGGVYWKKPDIGKHAITNGLFMAGALRLHQHGSRTVNGKTYRQWGEQTWRWIRSRGLINHESLVENGLNQACQLETGAFYTYNQGVMIGALIAYYEVTETSEYLQLATQIADATITRLVNEEGVLREDQEPTINGDSAQFKGVFMRHLATLYRHTQQQRHADFILKNADAIWTKARNEQTGEIGGLWDGPFDEADAARQSSALDALNAAIVVTDGR